MTKLSWDELDSRFYEIGVDRGVFFPQSGPGVPWSGLISVAEDEEVATQSKIYIDGIGLQNKFSLGVFSAQIEAFTYPDEFSEYDGFQVFIGTQKRKAFGFSYRTLIGEDHYLLHIVYNAVASPTLRNSSTVSNGTDVSLFSWDISTTPMKIPYSAPASHFVVDSRFTHAWTLEAIEDLIYGTDTSEATLPTVEALIELFESGAILRVDYHGDGSFTVTGPDSAIQMLDATTFQINWPSAIYTGEETYKLSSL